MPSCQYRRDTVCRAFNRNVCLHGRQARSISEFVVLFLLSVLVSNVSFTRADLRHDENLGDNKALMKMHIRQVHTSNENVISAIQSVYLVEITRKPIANAKLSPRQPPKTLQDMTNVTMTD